jgi:hypothetical protein
VEELKPETEVLASHRIDAFREMKDPMGNKCMFKRCTRRARVIAFYDSRTGEQQRASICYGHALDLANDSIGFYKFPEHQSDDPLTADG